MNYHLYLIIAGFLLLQSCGGLNRINQKPSLTVIPSKLVLAVDQDTDPYTVPLAFTVNIPRNYLSSCGRLVITLQFVNGDENLSLTPIIIQGKKYNGIEQRLLALEGTPLDYPDVKRYISTGKEMLIQVNARVPFQTWMPDSRFTLSSSFEACDQAVRLPRQTLADGVLYIPLGPGPVEVKYITKTVACKEEGFANFYYPANRYDVNPALYNNRAQLEHMTQLVQRVLNDTAIHVNRIVITGICSPDGTWKYNQTLAKERADYIKNYLVNNLHLDNDLISTNYIAEDWEGLVNLIKASDMANKQEVLDVIGRVNDDDQREIALRELPGYTYIKQNFYPRLRKVTYEIFYTIEETEEVAEPL